MDSTPDPELALLRLLVRGQIHKANNLLSTLNFAVEAFIDEDSRPEFEQLAGELTAVLRDLRCASAPCGEAAGDEAWTPRRAAETAGRLAAAAVNQRPQLLVDQAPSFRLDAEQAWSLTRTLAALLTGGEGRALALLPGAEPRALELSGVASLDPRRPWLRGVLEEGGWRWREGAAGIGLEARGSAAARPLTSAEALQIRRLLVLDDSPPVRSYLKLVLRKGGYDARFAASSEEALALVEVEDFDGYLIDRNLGEDDACRDGLEAAARLCALKPGPVIIMSGSEPSQSVHAAIARGEVVAYLAKPFDLGQLTRCLRGEG